MGFLQWIRSRKIEAIMLAFLLGLIVWGWTGALPKFTDWITQVPLSSCPVEVIQPTKQSQVYFIACDQTGAKHLYKGVEMTGDKK